MHGLEMNAQNPLSFQDEYHPRLILFRDVFIDINQKKSPSESLHFRKRDFFFLDLSFILFYFILLILVFTSMHFYVHTSIWQWRSTDSHQKKENFLLSCTGEYFVSNSKRQERELKQPPMGAVNTSVTAELHCFCWKLPAMQRPVSLLKVTSVFVNMHSARGASLAVTNCSAATGAYKGCLWFPLSGLCHKMLNTRSVCCIQTPWLLFRSTKLGEKFGRAEAKVPSHLSKTHWIPLSSFENPFYPMKIVWLYVPNPHFRDFHLLIAGWGHPTHFLTPQHLRHCPAFLYSDNAAQMGNVSPSACTEPRSCSPHAVPGPAIRQLTSIQASFPGSTFQGNTGGRGNEVPHSSLGLGQAPQLWWSRVLA